MLDTKQKERCRMSRSLKRLQKQIDSQIEAAFKIHFDRVQIPIMDIPRIYRIAHEKIEKGMSADEAVKSISMLYKNPTESVFS
jgi:signal transduction protein with GAF and PtsI domain